MLCLSSHTYFTLLLILFLIYCFLLVFLFSFFFFSIFSSLFFFFFFFFNDTATTEIYTLSLHDALPIFFVQDLTPSGISTVQQRQLLRQNVRELGKVG